MRLPTLAAMFVILAGQDSGSSTADGVYSPEQAERGRARYETVCQTCHAADLSGAVGSALKGEKFISDWSGLPLARLFERILTMPPNSPAPQPQIAAEDLLSYLLAMNGFPPGDALAADSLERIRFGSGDRPDPVPNFALVQIVGCVDRGTAGEWLVTEATAPIRTKNPEASPASERQSGPVRGESTFRLLNAYPSPDRLAGHLAEVKGFLIRGEIDSINVTALTSVAPACR